MKKIIILLSTVTVCSTVNAQYLSKGHSMIGGSFNTSGNTISSRDTSNITLTKQSTKDNNTIASLRFGRFITDRFMLGVIGSYINSTIKTNYDILQNGNQTITTMKATAQGFSGGAFARYYKMIGNSRFAVFGDLTFTYGQSFTKQKYEGSGASYYSSEGKGININAFIRPGLTYFFTNTIAGEAFFGNFGYSYSKNDSGKFGSPYSTTTKQSGFNSNLNFSLSQIAIGINFYFGGKHKSE